MGRKSEYYYNGVSLRQYCISNNLSYDSIKMKINKFKKEEKHNGCSDEELIDMALNSERKVKYRYQGKSLSKYCKENNLNIDKIRQKIIRLRKKHENYSDDLLVELAINLEATVRYTYKGKKLSKYCKENNLNFNVIRQRIYLLKEKEQYKYYTDYQLVELAINMKGKVKYKYHGENLSKYCKENNLSESSINSRIFKIRKNIKYKDYSDEQIAELAINNYLKLKNKKEVLDIMNKRNINEKDLIFVCDYFKVNIETIKKLKNKIKTNNAVYLVYYFGDKQDKFGTKYISQSKINEIRKLIDEVKDANEQDYDKYSLTDLIGLYKSKLYDTRNIILKRSEKYIKSYVYSECDKYNINVKSALADEFVSEINYDLLKGLENFNSNKEGQIITYINKLSKGSITRYLKKHINNMKELILNKKINDEDNEIIDFIKSPLDGFERLFKEDGFSIDILKSLLKLSKPDYKFVMLRFKDNYTYEELAEIYNVDIGKIIKKEKSILDKLKQDENFKKKVKKRRLIHI